MLIGDPKQSIYRFRGSDIASYLRAAATTTQRLSLAVNQRATQALVDATNALYAHAGDAFAMPDDAIRYVPVGAAGRADREPLHSGGMTIAQPLQLHRLDDDSDAAALAACVAQIAAYLEPGRWRIGDRALEPGDIAMDRIEDLPLPRIGVLKLVDQRHRPLRVQPIGERVAVLVAGSAGLCMHALDQVVERELPALRQALRPPFQQGRKHASQAVCLQDRVAREQQRRHRPCTDGDGIRQRVGHVLGPDLRMPERRVDECLEFLLVERGERVTGAQPRRQLAQPLTQRIFLAVDDDGGGEGLDARRTIRRRERGQQRIDLATDDLDARLQRRLDQFRPRRRRHAMERRQAAGLVAQRPVCEQPREIVEQFRFQLARRHQFARAEVRTRRQHLFGEDASAERVQGRDRRAIEFRQRPLHAPARFGGRNLRFQRREPVAQFGFGGADISRTIEVPPRPLQAGADAFAQLGRGGIGEGRDQNRFRAQSVFDHEAQVQHRDRPGLAGAGAGFDQHPSMRCRRRVQLQLPPVRRGRGHGVTSAIVSRSSSRCSAIAASISVRASAASGSVRSTPRASQAA